MEKPGKYARFFYTKNLTEKINKKSFIYIV